MGLLEKLFDNDKIKDMAFAMLKKQMIENGYKLIVISMDDIGAFKLDPFKEGEAIIVSADVQTKVEELIKGKDKVIEEMETAFRLSEDTMLKYKKRCEWQHQKLVAFQQIIDDLKAGRTPQTDYEPLNKENVSDANNHDDSAR